MRRGAPLLAVVTLISCNSILGNHDHYLDTDGGAGTAGSLSASAGDGGRSSGTAGTGGVAGSAGVEQGGDENAAGAATGGAAGDGGTSSTAGAGATSGGSGGRGGAAGTAGTTGVGGTSGTGGATGVAGASGAGGKTGVAGASGAGGTTATAGASGTSGASGSAGSSSVGPLPAITAGTSGFASRFWDCCKPTCGSTAPKLSCNLDGTTNGNTSASACTSGSAYACYDLAPFQDPQNQYVAYGFAASSAACGACYEVQFTGLATCSSSTSCSGSVTGLAQKTLFVQTISAGGIPAGEIDLLIPGGGVGAFNACSTEWGTTDLGSMYGGYPSECSGSASCVQTKCNATFSNKPDLLAGCNWFLGWFAGANNPQVVFKPVACPSQLTQKSGM